LQNTTLDGKFLDAIGLENTEIANPKFKGFKDAGKQCRTIEYLSHPVLGADGNLCLNLQLLAPNRRNQKYAAGFTNFDEVFLQILASVVQTKLQ